MNVHAKNSAKKVMETWEVPTFGKPLHANLSLLSN